MYIIVLSVVSTLAGSGSQAFADGLKAVASFCQPTGVAVDTIATHVGL